MWPYWIMYLIPALAALEADRRGRYLPWMPWIFLGLFFTLCIGFRFHVGGDWGSYLQMYHLELNRSFTALIRGGDPGYVLLNRLMAHLGWGIYGVNIACGLIFSCGLIVFCRSQSRPWLAFAVAVPYLIVVVAMGYTRQATAIGLIFWALAYLEQGKFIYYVTFIVVAVLFHKTAIIMIPVGIFLYKDGWLFRIIAVVLVSYGLWVTFVAQDQTGLWNNYVVQGMQSQGALVRVAINFVAAIALLLNWKQWKVTYPNALLWLWMALAAIACVPLVGLATTAVDRIALYLTPLQVVVFARLPYLARRQVDPETMVQGILLAYGAVLFVWLNYAVHARYWVPYRNVLFM
jgi:hypothetical protein